MQTAKQPRKPLYVTDIDNDKFAKIEQIVWTPIAWIFLFCAMGIFGWCILFAMYLGFNFL